ncbi:MAG: Ig domain-containing protein, partial [Synergistaceae bacterium]|nr:Ig domain-containing protein [Synergistaceae bacterium]
GDYAITWGASGLASGMSFNDGKLTVAANAVTASTYNVTVSADVTSNSITASPRKTVTVTVEPKATPPVVVSSITVDPGAAEVEVGKTVQLTATPVPATASYAWKSDDEGIAAVTNGVVTGVAAGSTTITAYLTNDDTVKDTCTVTVKANGGGGGGGGGGGPTPGPSPDPGPHNGDPDEEPDEDPDEDRGKVIDVTITIIEGGDGKPVAIFGLTAGGVPLAGMDLWAWLVPMLGGEEQGAFLGTTDIEGRLVLDVDDLVWAAGELAGEKAVIPAGTWRIRVALIDAATGERYAGLSIGTVSLPATSDGNDPNDGDGNGDEKGNGKGGSGGCDAMSLGALALLAGAALIARKRS